MKKCKDHLGNEYASRQEMAQAYGLSDSTLFARLKNKWPLEKALTTEARMMANSKACTDHKGNKFKSLSDMCIYWRIPVQLFKYWEKRGASLEDILERKIKPQKGGKKCKDHLGNEYESLTEMCRTYGINRYNLYSRLDRGCSLEEALTDKIKAMGKKMPCQDHLGNNFPGVMEMCQFYRVKYDTFKKRLKRGLTLEMALFSESLAKTMCTGLDGELYRSVKDMAKAYKVNAGSISYHLSNGTDYHNLLRPKDKKQRRTDHLGKTYPSVAAMCQAHGVKVPTFYTRLNNGMTLEEALSPTSPKMKAFELDGVKYASMKDFGRRQGIPERIINSAQNWGIRKKKKITLIARRAMDVYQCSIHKDPKLQKIVGKNIIKVEGQTYSSIRDLCRRRGIKETEFRKQRSQGLSVSAICKVHANKEQN